MFDLKTGPNQALNQIIHQHQHQFSTQLIMTMTMTITITMTMTITMTITVIMTMIYHNYKLTTKPSVIVIITAVIAMKKVNYVGK